MPMCATRRAKTARTTHSLGATASVRTTSSPPQLPSVTASDAGLLPCRAPSYGCASAAAGCGRPGGHVHTNARDALKFISATRFQRGHAGGASNTADTAAIRRELDSCRSCRTHRYHCNSHQHRYVCCRVLRRRSLHRCILHGRVLHRGVRRYTPHRRGGVRRAAVVSGVHVQRRRTTARRGVLGRAAVRDKPARMGGRRRPAPGGCGAGPAGHMGQ